MGGKGPANAEKGLLGGGGGDRTPLAVCWTAGGGGGGSDCVPPTASSDEAIPPRATETGPLGGTEPRRTTRPPFRKGLRQEDPILGEGSAQETRRPSGPRPLWDAPPPPPGLGGHGRAASQQNGPGAAGAQVGSPSLFTVGRLLSFGGGQRPKRRLCP